MSLTRIFVFVLSCFRLVLGNNASDVDRKYENLQTNLQLVLDVQKWFESQTVFIVYSDDDENMRMTNLMMSLIRKFSKEEVYSMMMNYTEMQNYEEYYRYRIRRPLFVVFLHSMKQVERFRNITRHYHVAYPLWLLIFSRDLPHVCDRPETNYFQVRFNTRMMAKCHGDPIIREWYSIDGKGMRYLDFASWHYNTEDGYEDRFQFFHREGLFNRRYDLERIELRIATVKDSAFIMKQNHGYQGYFAGILTELQEVLNFTVKHDYTEETYGAKDKRTGKYNGVIGRLESEEVDLGVGEFTMTAPRLDVVDFTMPIMVSKNYLYIRRPDKSYLLWSAYFKVYTFFSWLALQGMFYLSIGIVTVIQLITKEKPMPSNYIAENWISVWGIYCQQGLPEFPKATPARIAYFSILTTSVILLSVYSACLVSYLAYTPPIELFNNFNEFAADGSYELIAFYKSSDYDLFMTSNDTLLTKMSKLMRSQEDLPRTMMQGFKQVCARRVAFYATEAVKSPVTKRIPCGVVTVKSGTIGSLGMTLTKNNQYKGLIDFFLKKFRDHGIMSKIRTDVYDAVDKPRNTFTPVPLNGLAILFIILWAGLLISLVVLFVEIVVYRRNCCRIDRKQLPMHADHIVVTRNARIPSRRY